ncbi:helix-turn-helix transcriptional regulator [Pseudonocardia alaniniphila]|uniref:AAA family ATPase n=1 Tax=Pseudonocardia alaniniphila TaxID=75291 RepID=A0ABS9TUZ8_9PSEU|nr:helix-turn-helix transcriptional regulator [Pseudonocardia alaniniphila]MCH6172385.1 AAA family ATPase [Pseudonocardia alaniniphila]
MTALLLDRRSECQLLDRLLEDVRTGRSRAVVVRGEAGVGKTTLLAYLLGRAAGCRVARATGVQAEVELAFAGLHQVCAPMLVRLGGLPEAQQEALSRAFGLRTGNPPNRFAVGLAVLGLFAEVARERPLVCVVDDAQWLDRASAQVLAFVARRLQAESVAIVFAVRDSISGEESVEEPELAGLPEVEVIGLPEDDARALLRFAHCGPVDERVREQVLAEAQGNPLALLELPRGFTPSELAGESRSPSRGKLSRQIEESYCRQIIALPAETRELLLVAAAEPVGDPVLVWQAAERLGIAVDAAGPAEAVDLIHFGPRVRFRHPLVRSATYEMASSESRRRSHGALAQVTDPQADPDRRAWHNAKAVAGRDEDVAAELVHSAGRAQARGGVAAAAAFLERATHLSPDPARRGQRAMAAAQAKHLAGLPDSALGLLTLAEASPLTELERARADLLRAQIALTMNRGGDVPSLLLKAAARLEPLNMRQARDTYLDASMAAWFAAHLTGGAGMREVGEAVRNAPAPPHPSTADLLLDALALRFTDGYAAAAPDLKRALRAFRDRGPSEDERFSVVWFTYIAVAAALADDEIYEVLTRRFLELARDAGALALLPLALTSRIAWYVFTGKLDAAASLLEEQKAVMGTTIVPVASYGTMLLPAWRGLETGTFTLIEAESEENARRGEGTGVICCGWIKALLCNGLCMYDEALTAAQAATEPSVEIGMPTWASLVERVEAAVRVRQPDLATDAFRQLTPLTRAGGTDWALGLEARCRALIGDGPAAESAYCEAIERLGRTHIRGELARAHLVYGEWLRRERRRSDAHDQLRAAHEMFMEMGAEGFARRTARELGAIGVTARKRTVETTTELTTQETQIAHLVRQGLTNPEIAARLFLSPRTVEWHIRKIFSKLNITSRRQLRS